MASTIAQYRGMLKISKYRLDEELEIQSDVQERISSEVTRLNSRMLEAKEGLAKIEARLGEDFRDSDAKLTVAQVQAKVQRHGERTRAWDLLQAARGEHEEAAGLLDAWRQRGYSIKTLADLYGSQYFSLRSTSGPRLHKESESRAARLAEDSVREAQPDMLPRRRRRED